MFVTLFSLLQCLAKPSVRILPFIRILLPRKWRQQFPLKRWKLWGRVSK
jgi:hypothetical protein